MSEQARAIADVPTATPKCIRFTGLCHRNQAETQPKLNKATDMDKYKIMAASSLLMMVSFILSHVEGRKLLTFSTETGSYIYCI